MGEANFYYFTCLKFGYRNKKMGISQAKWHKKRKTGGKRPTYKKKRKYEMGRPASMTKIGGYRVHLVRVRGGNIKRRALRLDTGNFSWGSEAIARKARIIDTVYNASNNELVRTKTLVKNAIISIDAAPFRQWYEAHYALPIGRKKGAKLTEADEALFNKKRSKKTHYRQQRQEKRLQQLPSESVVFFAAALAFCLNLGAICIFFLNIDLPLRRIGDVNDFFVSPELKMFRLHLII